MSTKSTYQPSKVHRARTHGFLSRLRKSKLGNRFNILKRRRSKGRVRLTSV